MKILKLEDLVTFKTVPLLFNAKNGSLPSNFQRLFFEKESKICTYQMKIIIKFLSVQS